MGDPLVELAVIQLARDDRPAALALGEGLLLDVQAEVSFSLPLVRPMTGETFVGKNGADIAVELDGGLGRKLRGDGEKHPDKGQGCSKRGSCCNWHFLVLQKSPEAGSAGGPGYPC